MPRRNISLYGNDDNQVVLSRGNWASQALVLNGFCVGKTRLELSLKRQRYLALDRRTEILAWRNLSKG
jgi:hypothetical protein